MDAVSLRRFGVEIECGHPNRDYAATTQTLRRATRAASRWDIGNDGSGLEVRTPPLQGQRGFDTLERAMKALVDDGYFVSTADGMHVHLESIDYVGNLKLIRALARSWVNLEPVIEQFVNPCRVGYGPAPKWWTKKRVNELGQESRLSRYNLNLANVLSHSRPIRNYNSATRTYEFVPRQVGRNSECTTEIRLHEGSLNYLHAQAWIALMQLLMDRVAETGKTIPICKRPATLLKWLDMPDLHAEVLLDKAANMPQQLGLDAARRWVRNGNSIIEVPRTSMKGRRISEVSVGDRPFDATWYGDGSEDYYQDEPDDYDDRYCCFDCNGY